MSPHWLLTRAPIAERRLIEGARREGEINLYSSLVVEDLTAIAAAFDKKYGIKVKFWRAGSEKVVQRIVTEARAGRFDFDVVETNGPELESLHRELLLQKATSRHFADILPQALMAHREWVGTRLNMFVHAYNTNLVKKKDLPKSYRDLLDPKWKGKLAIEAEDMDWFATLVKEMGEEKGLKLFRDIVRTNGISVRKGHTLLAGLVASGEVPFALTVYKHNAEVNYAIHDTRQALDEARKFRITRFVLTIDPQGNDYLRILCDGLDYEMLQDINQLPARLLKLYHSLTF